MSDWNTAIQYLLYSEDEIVILPRSPQQSRTNQSSTNCSTGQRTRASSTVIYVHPISSIEGGLTHDVIMEKIRRDDQDLSGINRFNAVSCSVIGNEIEITDTVPSNGAPTTSNVSQQQYVATPQAGEQTIADNLIELAQGNSSFHIPLAENVETGKAPFHVLSYEEPADEAVHVHVYVSEESGRLNPVTGQDVPLSSSGPLNISVESNLNTSDSSPAVARSQRAINSEESSAFPGMGTDIHPYSGIGLEVGDVARERGEVDWMEANDEHEEGEVDLKDGGVDLEDGEVAFGGGEVDLEDGEVDLEEGGANLEDGEVELTNYPPSVPDPPTSQIQIIGQLSIAPSQSTVAGAAEKGQYPVSAEYLATVEQASYVQDGKYMCRVCGKGFSRKCILSDHITTHTGFRPFNCRGCQSGFLRRSSLAKHMTACHHGEAAADRADEATSSYCCTVCGKSFPNSETLQAHFTQHTKDGEKSPPQAGTDISLRCSKCEETFSTPPAFVEHIRLCINESCLNSDDGDDSYQRFKTLGDEFCIYTGTSYRCKQCNEEFKRKSSLNEHVVKHTAVYPFHCPQCSRPFERKRALTRHLQSCALVKEMLPNMQNMSLEEQQSGGFTAQPTAALGAPTATPDSETSTSQSTASLAPIDFLQLDKTERYQKYLSLGKAGSEWVGGIFRCKICGQSSSVQGNMNSHIVTHTKIAPYECDYCKKPYTRKECLVTHYSNCQKAALRAIKAEKNLESNPKDSQNAAYLESIDQGSVIKSGKLTCRHCGITFKEQATMNAHILTHTGIYPVNCGRCNKGFSDCVCPPIEQLTMVGSEGMWCKKCNRQFVDQDALNKHITTHTNIMPYSCPLCHKGFHRRESLTKHTEVCAGENFSTQENTNKQGKDNVDGSYSGTTHKKKAPTPKNSSRLTNRGYKSPSNISKELYPVSEDYKASVKKYTERKGVLFCCTLCDKKCERPDQLADHIIQHTNIYPFNCPVCTGGFRRRGIMVTHIANCTGESPKTKAKRQKLGRLKGRGSISLQVDGAGGSENESEEEPADVNLLKNIFGDATLAADKTDISEDPSTICTNTDVSTTPPKNPSPSKTRVENLSPDVFQVSEDYLASIQELSWSEGSTLICSVCEQTFVDASNLNDHITTHTGIKPFNCPCCKEGFLRKMELANHMLNKCPNDTAIKASDTVVLTVIPLTNQTNAPDKTVKTSDKESDSTDGNRVALDDPESGVSASLFELGNEVTCESIDVFPGYGGESDDSDKGNDVSNAAQGVRDPPWLNARSSTTSGVKTVTAKTVNVNATKGTPVKGKVPAKTFPSPETGVLDMCVEEICDGGSDDDGDYGGVVDDSDSDATVDWQGGGDNTPTRPSRTSKPTVTVRGSVTKQKDQSLTKAVKTAAEKVGEKSPIVEKTAASSLEVSEAFTKSAAGIIMGGTKGGYVCRLCGKTYQNRSDIAYHAATHTGIKPYNCHMCGSGFGKRFMMANHLKKCSRKEKVAHSKPALKNKAAGKPETVPVPTRGKVGLRPHAGKFSSSMQLTDSSVDLLANCTTKLPAIQLERIDPTSPSVILDNEYKIPGPRSRTSGRKRARQASPEPYPATRTRGTTDTVTKRSRQVEDLDTSPVMVSSDGEDGSEVRAGRYTRASFRDSLLPPKVIKKKATSVQSSKLAAPKVEPRPPAAKVVVSTEYPDSIRDGMRRKHGKFYCRSCSRCFNRQQDIAIHLPSHTGIYPFSCSACDKGYIQMKKLRIHIRRCRDKKTQRKQIPSEEVEEVQAPRSLRSKGTPVNEPSAPEPSTPATPPVVQDPANIAVSEAYLKSIDNGISFKQGRLCCKACEKAFTDLKKLREHITTHTGILPFNCLNCQQGYLRKDHLVRHIKTCDGSTGEAEQKPEPVKFTPKSAVKATPVKGKHEPELVVSKGRCSRNSTPQTEKQSRSSMPQVQKESKNKPTPSAVDVNAITMSAEFLKVFKKNIVNKDGMLYCKLCPVHMRSAGNMYDHVGSHTGIHTFKCPFCTVSRSRRPNLGDHIRKTHDVKVTFGTVSKGGQLEKAPAKKQMSSPVKEAPTPVKAKESKSGYARSTTVSQEYLESLEKNIRTKGGVDSCKICKSSFPTRQTLNDHIASETGICPFVCYKCGHGTKRPGKMVDHLKTCAGKKGEPAPKHAKSPSKTPQKTSSTPTRGTKSPASLSTTGNTDLLSKAYLACIKKNTGSKGGTLFCRICNKRFRHLRELHEHITGHTGIKPYMCPDCKLGYTLKQHLKRHFITCKGASGSKTPTKAAKTEPKSSKAVKSGPKSSKPTKSGPKSSKAVKSGPKSSTSLETTTMADESWSGSPVVFDLMKTLDNLRQAKEIDEYFLCDESIEKLVTCYARLPVVNLGPRLTPPESTPTPVDTDLPDSKPNRVTAEENATAEELLTAAGLAVMVTNESKDVKVQPETLPALFEVTSQSEGTASESEEGGSVSGKRKSRASVRTIRKRFGEMSFTDSPEPSSALLDGGDGDMFPEGGPDMFGDSPPMDDIQRARHLASLVTATDTPLKSSTSPTTGHTDLPTTDVSSLTQPESQTVRDNDGTTVPMETEPSQTTTDDADKDNIAGKVKVTDKDDVTDKANVTDKDDVTDKANVTDKDNVTDKANVTDKDDVTDKANVTDKGDVTDKADVTDKGDVTAKADNTDKADVIGLEADSESKGQIPSGGDQDNVDCRATPETETDEPAKDTSDNTETQPPPTNNVTRTGDIETEGPSEGGRDGEVGGLTDEMTDTCHTHPDTNMGSHSNVSLVPYGSDTYSDSDEDIEAGQGSRHGHVTANDVGKREDGEEKAVHTVNTVNTPSTHESQCDVESRSQDNENRDSDECSKEESRKRVRVTVDSSAPVEKKPRATDNNGRDIKDSLTDMDTSDDVTATPTESMEAQVEKGDTCGSGVGKSPRAELGLLTDSDHDDCNTDAFSCQICQKTFPSKLFLRMHVPHCEGASGSSDDCGSKIAPDPTSAKVDLMTEARDSPQMSPPQTETLDRPPMSPPQTETPDSPQMSLPQTETPDSPQMSPPQTETPDSPQMSPPQTETPDSPQMFPSQTETPESPQMPLPQTETPESPQMSLPKTETPASLQMSPPQTEGASGSSDDCGSKIAPEPTFAKVDLMTETPESPQMSPPQTETPDSPQMSPPQTETPDSPQMSPPQTETLDSPQMSPPQTETPDSPQMSPPQTETLDSPQMSPPQTETPDSPQMSPPQTETPDNPQKSPVYDVVDHSA